MRRPRHGKAGVKPIDIDFTDIRRRVSILNVGTNYSAKRSVRTDRWLLVNGDGNLYVYPLEPQPAAEAAGAAAAPAWRRQTRQLTTSPGGKSNRAVHADSREVFYLEGGRINVANVESRQSRAINVTAELDVDFSKEKMEVFPQAWTYMRDGFYDEKYHGADWGEVRAQFTPIVAGVRTPDELRRVLNLMLGELNASHNGALVAAGGGDRRRTTAGSACSSIAPSTSRAAG
jgi:hypothetical protein